MSSPTDFVPIRRALISVYDKRNVVPFAKALAEHDVEIISTGGTAKVLSEAGLEVSHVEDLTGYPEMLGGRVKSLHPVIQAGLLARQDEPGDMADLEENGISPIDLVVSNLYPFQAATKEISDPEKLVEFIDIGGPCMVRAAAKNHRYVGVITSPDQYEECASLLDEHDGRLPFEYRRALAGKAFHRTARYDQAITNFFSDGALRDDQESRPEKSTMPDKLQINVPRATTLRYGENPHQEAALYGSMDAFYDTLHGKSLSYNNLLDVNAALLLIDEFRDDDPTCAILKHTNPCGVGTADRLEAAYQRAFSTDRQSPFGGIVVVNRALDRATAEAIDRIFTEVIIAPDYEEGVLNMLMQKKNRRLLRSRDPARRDVQKDMRSVLGGYLVQERDPVVLPLRTKQDEWQVTTKREPTTNELRDLRFAWRVVKHVKSNAIVYAKDLATLGIGAGQMSRIDASELAVRKGKKSELDFQGSVVASDAFFPFADGLEAAAETGARAAIQPGGSIRDDEVIKAADDRDMAMVFTGSRHFRH